MRTRFALPALLALVAALPGEEPKAPSEIHLVAGDVVTGVIVKQDDASVTVRTEVPLKSGKTMAAERTYQRKDIDKIVDLPAPGDEYAQKLKAVQPTADDHYKLALWCRDHSLRDHEIEQLKASLALEPTYGPSRTLITSEGLIEIDGAWLTADELKAKTGQILVDGKAMSPEEAEKYQAQHRARILADGLKRQVDEADGSLRKIDRELADAKAKQQAAEGAQAKADAEAKAARARATEAAAQLTAAEAADRQAQADAANAGKNGGTTAGNNGPGGAAGAASRTAQTGSAVASAKKARDAALREADTLEKRAPTAKQEAARWKAQIEELQGKRVRVEQQRAELATKLADAEQKAAAEAASAPAAPAK